MTTKTRGTKKDESKALTLIANTLLEKGADKSTPDNAITGHEALVDKLIRRYCVYKTSTDAFKDLEEEVIAIARDEYERRATGANEVGFTKSIHLVGEQFPYLMITFNDKFSGLKDKDVEVILEAFSREGAEKNVDDPADYANEQFAKFFTVERTISLKPAATDNATIALLGDLLTLAEMISDDNVDPLTVLDEKGVKSLRTKIRAAKNRGAKLDFKELFTSDLSISAKKGMDKEQFMLPESVRRQLKQGKPTTNVTAKIHAGAVLDEAVSDIRDLILASE